MTKPARGYVSDPILSEYATVLASPELKIRKSLRQQLLQLIKSHAHVARPSRLGQDTSDPADNIFIECADRARADYLVTGNQRHFPKFWKNTKIISSGEFLSVIASPPDWLSWPVYVSFHSEPNPFVSRNPRAFSGIDGGP